MGLKLREIDQPLFHFGNDVADIDLVAYMFEPFDDGALGHGVREFWHFDVYWHGGVGM